MVTAFQLPEKGYVVRGARRGRAQQSAQIALRAQAASPPWSRRAPYDLRGGGHQALGQLYDQYGACAYFHWLPPAPRDAGRDREAQTHLTPQQGQRPAAARYRAANRDAQSHGVCTWVCARTHGGCPHNNKGCDEWLAHTATRVCVAHRTKHAVRALECSAARAAMPPRARLTCVRGVAARQTTSAQHSTAEGRRNNSCGWQCMARGWGYAYVRVPRHESSLRRQVPRGRFSTNP